jgi:RimJ/RimL family protein N-acetyltransferase
MIKNNDYSYRKACMGDAEQLFIWRRSPEISQNMLTQLDNDLAQHLAWFKRELTNKSRLMFILQYQGQAIGFFSFYDINKLDKTATFTWYLGESTFRGIGCGGYFLDIFLHYFKHTLQLYRLRCMVKNNNIRGKNLYLNKGFTLLDADLEYVYLEYRVL